MAQKFCEKDAALGQLSQAAANGEMSLAEYMRQSSSLTMALTKWVMSGNVTVVDEEFRFSDGSKAYSENGRVVLERTQTREDSVSST